MDISNIITNRVVQASAIAGVCAAGAGFGAGYFIGIKRGKRTVEFVPEQMSFDEVTDPGGGIGEYVEGLPNPTFTELPERILEMDKLGEDGPVAIVAEADPEFAEFLESEEANLPQPVDHFSEPPEEDEDLVLEHVESDPKLEEVVETVTEETVLEVVRDEEMEAEVSEEAEDESHSIFAASDDDWDYDAERANRTEDEPYILHVDEYMSDELGFKQADLTYYSGDDMLIDEQLVPVYERSLLGELKFGHGSGSPNVVYIRNHKQKAEWQVLLFDGYYEREVLGIEQDAQIEGELQHSLTSRRFRPHE